MNTAYLNANDFSFFSGAQAQLAHLIQELQSAHYAEREHGDIENFIHKEGMEILRRLLQGWLDLKATNEETRDALKPAQGTRLNHVRTGTSRTLNSLFGRVTVIRKSYRQRNETSVFPMDATLNLANDRYSDGIRYRTSKAALRGSFDDVVESVGETTGGRIPKRQSLNIVRDVAQDFEDFYRKRRFIEPEATSDLLVLSFDGKGIVMRPEGLRDVTQKAAQKRKKLKSRLSQGEKKDRKRMAQVAAVYTVQPHVRTPASIMKTSDDENVLPFRTPIRNKRVWASVEREAEEVIEEAFLEAYNAIQSKKDNGWF